MRYKNCLKQVSKNSLKYIILAGLGFAAEYSMFMLTYGFGYWFGSHCVEGSSICNSNQTYTVGNVIAIFFIIMIIGWNVSQFAPTLKKIV